jgi:hypothetical protein
MSEFFDYDVVTPKMEITNVIDETAPKTKRVSFSQYSLWLKCNYAWKLAYLDGLRVYQDSIHTIFGTAIHEVVQHYIELLYTDGKGAPVADDYPIKQAFKEKFEKLYAAGKFGDTPVPREVFEEFLIDGNEILDFFTRPVNRMQYFPSRAYKIVGIELPLEIDLKNNLKYIGYLDVVLQNRTSGNIKILDIKTSTFNWNKYQKSDNGKIDQLILYKKFYSETFNVPLDNIEIEFIILKRKLDDNGFSKSRISTFEPANGKTTIKKTAESFDQFITAGFTADGIYNKESVFERTDNKNACKYCDFHKKQCPGYLKKNEK